jgi:hypothetical protein
MAPRATTACHNPMPYGTEMSYYATLFCHGILEEIIYDIPSSELKNFMYKEYERLCFGNSTLNIY